MGLSPAGLTAGFAVESLSLPRQQRLGRILEGDNEERVRELVRILREEEKVTPEVLVTIAAAVSTFLGKKINIRSAKSLQSPYEVINPWSQQGRVFVQASHNLRSRR